MTTKPVVTNLYPLRDLDIAGFEYRVEGFNEVDYYRHFERLRGKAENSNGMYLETYRGRIYSFDKLPSIPKQMDLVGPWSLSEVEDGMKRRVLIRGYIRHYLSSEIQDYLVSPIGITTEVVNWKAVSIGDSKRGVLKVLKYTIELVPLPDGRDYLSLDVGYRLMSTDFSKGRWKTVLMKKGPRLRKATLKGLSPEVATLVDQTTGEEFRVGPESIRRPVSLARERPNVDTRIDPPDRFRLIRDVAKALQDIVQPQPREIHQLTRAERQKMGAGWRNAVKPPVAVKVLVLKYVEDPLTASDLEVLTLLRRAQRFSLCPRFQNIVAIGHDDVFFRNMDLILNGQKGRQTGYVEMIESTGGVMDTDLVRLQTHRLRNYLDAIDDADAPSMFVVQVDPPGKGKNGNWYDILKSALKTGSSKSQFMEIDRKRPGSSAYGAASAMNFALQMHAKGEGVPYRIQYKTSLSENPEVVAISTKRRASDDGRRHVGAVCTWRREDDWHIAYHKAEDAESLEADLLESIVPALDQSENLISMLELSEYGTPRIRDMVNLTTLLREEHVPILGYRQASIRAFKGIGRASGPSTPKNLVLLTGCTSEYSGGYVTPTGRPFPPRWARSKTSTGTPVPVHAQLIEPSGTEDTLGLLELSVALANYHPNSLVNYSLPAPLHFAMNARSFEGEPL